MASLEETTPGTISSSSASMTVKKNFTISKMTTKHVKRFNTKGNLIEFKVNEVPYGENPLSWFKKTVNEIIAYAMETVEPDDYIGLYFCSKDFKEKAPGWVNFRKAHSFTFGDIWNILNSVFQSNANSLNTDTFCIGVTSVRLPKGQGNGRRFYNNYEDMSQNSKGIINIINSDNLCLPRSIVTAIAQFNSDVAYKTKVKRDSCKIQTQLTLELLRNSGVTIPEAGGGICELQKFQSYLKDYRITVYRYGNKNNSKGRDVLFEGKPVNKNTKSINLLHHDNHYNVITSTTAVFCCRYYCENCHIAYNNKNGHRCKGNCYNCLKNPPCKKENGISCFLCKRSFVSIQCFENHTHSSAKQVSTCQTIRKCIECLKIIKPERDHVCGEIFCTICKKHQPQGHLCYIQKNEKIPVLKNKLLIFFDLETRQETLQEGTSNKVHEPNLCVFNQRCDECENIDDLFLCLRCGIRQQVLKLNPIERFIEYVLNQRLIFKQIICIAHNGQSFDHQFILNCILQTTKIIPELIQRGSKILLLQIDNIKFIDSLNYFPMKLSLLPKAFDLPNTFKKGYFPHLFNTLNNANYIGKLPPIEFYSPDTMKGSEDYEENNERNSFIKWFKLHENDDFNMEVELVDYCKNDVNILMYACLKFRKDFLTICNVCPFTEAITIASACNLVFRRNFLKPESIGIIPRNGYRWTDNQSMIAIQWLLWEEKRRKIKIINAAVQKEAIVHGVKVDGYCIETNQIFEFHGCYYHGHPECMDQGRNLPLHEDPDDTLNRRFAYTQAKTQRLRQKGYEVIEKWECHFKRELDENSKMKFLKDHSILKSTPLNPRDTFYGGRTGNAKMYYKAKKGEQIKYIDVCSLYPWVCKYGKFPVGHPKLHIGENNCRNIDLKNINGLIKCTVLPPRDLYHPVLPMKQNNKLMFSLCFTCAETLNQNDCKHNTQERALHGTWVIDEVNKSIEKGYKILAIDEIWEYEVEQYNASTKSGGLFTEMMNKFLEMKQSASGFPANCSTEEQRVEYIEHFFNTEGIKMKFSDIVKNAGLRSLAKLILNSFWGKFGQRENLPKTCIINQPSQLFELLIKPSVNVNNILPINEDTLAVNWEFKEEAEEMLPTVNVCIAAYTTTQARLKLYEYLDALGERVLYYDTDSVIYVSKDGQYDPPTGNCIGDMTDELNEYGLGSYISEFVSGGPKNYAYKIWSTQQQKEKVVCKVKGFSLNYEVSKQINFDSIKNMVINDDPEDEICIISKNIRRTQCHTVITKTESKNYQIKALKRRFLENYDSIPYGFKKRKLFKNV